MRILLMTVACAVVSWAQAAQPLRMEKSIEMPDVQGRIDHLSIDTKGQRLFVSALGNNTLEVIDVKLGKRVKTVSSLKEPQGVLYVAESDRLMLRTVTMAVFESLMGVLTHL